MLRVWDAAVAPPTRDIYFLGRVDNMPEAIRGIVAECLSIQLDDGLAFESGIDDAVVPDPGCGRAA